MHLHTNEQKKDKRIFEVQSLAERSQLLQKIPRKRSLTFSEIQGGLESGKIWKVF